jgi:pimeloyl-ACP methyl ester carboxylesterase
VIRVPTVCLSIVLFGLLVVRFPAVQAQEGAALPVGVVFSVDGSGRLREMGDDLRQAVADAHLPLRVETFAWSHGAGRIFADLHGSEHQKAKGLELAGLVLAHLRASPASKVYLVSHSSGAAILLAAAGHLPPGSVERIILLAPALAPGCDLRPALRCAQQGIDSFHSRNDVIGHCLALVGTADGQFLFSASCVGFAPVAEDSRLYVKLRQHAWGVEMTRTGYYGGHFGCTHGNFLRAYVVPLLAGSRQPPPAGDRPKAGYKRKGTPPG